MLGLGSLFPVTFLLVQRSGEIFFESLEIVAACYWKFFLYSFLSAFLNMRATPFEKGGGAVPYFLPQTSSSLLVRSKHPTQILPDSRRV